jgi:hypothetical protein
MGCRNRKTGEAFEEGSDAMLKALFKMAEESPTGKFMIDSHEVSIW